MVKSTFCVYRIFETLTVLPFENRGLIHHQLWTTHTSMSSAISQASSATISDFVAFSPMSLAFSPKWYRVMHFHVNIVCIGQQGGFFVLCHKSVKHFFEEQQLHLFALSSKRNVYYTSCSQTSPTITKSKQH